MSATRGSTINVGPGYNYTTIQSAIDVASLGDTIALHGGPYQEDVEIRKDYLEIEGGFVNLQGSLLVTGNHTIIGDLVILGNGVGDTVFITGNYTSIHDMKVIGSGSEELDAGIHIEGHHQNVANTSAFECNIGFRIGSTILKAQDDDPMHRSYFSQCLAKNNTNHGFFLCGAKNTALHGCESTGNGGNGYEHFVSQHIYHRTSATYNSGSGFGIHDSDDVTIELSVSSFNGNEGVDSYFNVADRIWIKNSDIIENGYDGIYISPFQDILVEENVIFGNRGNGVRIGDQGTDEGTYVVRYNLIMNNTEPGVELMGGNEPTHVYGNDLINNDKDRVPALDNTTSTWDDGELGNYWSVWNSPDNDVDGIVDAPYDIPGTGGSKDRYPRSSRATTFAIPDGSTWNDSVGLAPRILDLVVNCTAGEEYSSWLRAEDRDTPSSSLVWTMSTDALWLGFSGDRINGTPPEAGTFNITLTVSDGTHSVTRVFMLFVRNPPSGPANKAPTILTNPQRTATVGKFYSVTFDAEDEDGDDLSWDLFTDADFLSMSGRVLSGTPDETGNFTVMVKVFDGKVWNHTIYTLYVEEDEEEIPTVSISLGVNGSTGGTTFSIGNVTGGIVIAEIEWYIDGVYSGNSTTLDKPLLEGDHTITLRVKDSDGNWYEATKVVKGTTTPERDGDILVFILIAVIAVLISSAVAGVFIMRRVRREQRDRMVWSIAEDEGPRVSRSVAVPLQETTLRVGTLDPPGPLSRDERLSGIEVFDDPYIEPELQLVRAEALNYKRASRFTMRRRKMMNKLSAKRRSGEIDPDTYREIRDHLFSYMEE